MYCVVALLRQLVGNVEQAAQVIRDVNLARIPALHRGEMIQRVPDLGAQHVHVDLGLGQQWPDAASVLIQQSEHQVHRLDELVIAPKRQALGFRQRHLKLACQFVHSHGATPAAGFEIRVSGEIGAGRDGIKVTRASL